MLLILSFHETWFFLFFFCFPNNFWLFGSLLFHRASKLYSCTKNTASSSVLNKGPVFTDIDLAKPYLWYKIKNLNDCMNFQFPSSEYDIHSSL